MLLRMCIHTYIHRCIHICSYIHLELLLLLADDFQFKLFFQLDHRQMQGLAHLGKERERQRSLCMYICMYLCIYVCIMLGHMGKISYIYMYEFSVFI